MRKTILTVIGVALVAAFAAGCATNLSGLGGADSASATKATEDPKAVIDVPIVQEGEQTDTDNAQNTDGSSDADAVDVPPNNNGYRDEELLTWASKYYEFTSGNKAPNIEIDHVEGDMVHIHIFEDLEPAKEGESDPGHRTTLEWYVVDRKTGIGKNFAGEEVDLTSMYKRTMTNEEAVG